MNTPPGSLPRVVIVGAGFGGLRAAQALGNAPAIVTVIDRSNHHLFQPLLYQVATATLSPADIASPIRSVLRDQANVDVLMAEVLGVDVANRQVKLRDRAIPYDYLVLSTGARHAYFGHEDWERFAPGLKTISDATEIRKKILLAFESAEMEPDGEKRAEWLTFALVGGGPTGVEMAGAIAELAHRALAMDFRRIDPKSTRVILVEAGPRLLACFPDDLAHKARTSLEALGVEVRTQSRVERIDQNGIWIGGKCLPARTILWTAGVVASPAGSWIGAEADRFGRVKVKPDLSVPGHPEIFVIGDTAAALGANGEPLPGVAPVAMQQGKYVGALIQSRMESGPEGTEGAPPFRYKDKGSLATIGRSSAVADVAGLHLSGFIAWLAWLTVHIYYLIGFRNRLLVMMEWAWAYGWFQRGARLIVLKVIPLLVFFACAYTASARPADRHRPQVAAEPTLSIGARRARAPTSACVVAQAFSN